MKTQIQEWFPINTYIHIYTSEFEWEKGQKGNCNHCFRSSKEQSHSCNLKYMQMDGWGAEEHVLMDLLESCFPRLTGAHDRKQDFLCRGWGTGEEDWVQKRLSLWTGVGGGSTLPADHWMALPRPPPSPHGAKVWPFKELVFKSHPCLGISIPNFPYVVLEEKWRKKAKKNGKSRRRRKSWVRGKTWVL